jgi:hypothetical protein
MSHAHLETEGGAAAETLPPDLHTQDESLRSALREHVNRLRLILPVISVSVMALHRQNAELDDDIACVLGEHACIPLDEEIEHLQTILGPLPWRKRQQEARV